MSYNKNMKMVYPEQTDYYDVDVFNQNFSYLADYAQKGRLQAVVVASSTSTNNLASFADFTCSDTNAGIMIKNAVDTAGTGGLVILLDGTFYVEQSIYVDKGVTITGLTNQKTKLVPIVSDGAAPNIFFLTEENAHLKNMKLADASDAETAESLIQVNTRNCIIENVVIENSSSLPADVAAIDFNTHSSGGLVKYCRFYRTSDEQFYDINIQHEGFGGVFAGCTAFGYAGGFRKITANLPSQTAYDRTAFSGQITSVYMDGEAYADLTGK